MIFLALTVMERTPENGCRLTRRPPWLRGARSACVRAVIIEPDWIAGTYEVDLRRWPCARLLGLVLRSNPQ